MHRFRAREAPPPPQSDVREHILKLLRLSPDGRAFPTSRSSLERTKRSMTVVVLIACNLLLAGLFSLVAVVVD